VAFCFGGLLLQSDVVYTLKSKSRIT
jgi:hypothetical protein